MLKDFKLSKSIGNFFGEAFDLFQMGAKAYDIIEGGKQRKEDDSFIPRKMYNFDSALRSARPTPQMMQAPIGLKNPNLQAAFRYFAQNTARDVNLASLAANNYKASTTRKRQNVGPNFNAGSFGNAGIGSARSNRVGRARFRSHLSS
tara:strand:- start:3627 stop:4067 length:441 start_codon:yes stop_codon:yes gene_type:complete